MSFLGVPVRAGQQTRVRVSVGEFLDGTPIAVPVVTIGGRSGGPTLYLQAGLHGDEQTGIEVVRRALTDIDFTELRGDVVVVPLANVPAHLTRTRGFLHEERWMVDINRIFPGNGAGLLTERIASTLFEEFVSAADMTFDVHSGLDGCLMLPTPFVDPDDDDNGTLEVRKRMAYGFGAGRVYHRARADKIGTSDMSRSIGAQSDAIGKPTVSVDMGESRQVAEQFVDLGVRGVHNVLKVLDMLPGEPDVPETQRPFSTITVVHVSRGGGLRRLVDVAEEVEQGQRIGVIVNVFGEVVEELTAPVSGFVMRAMLLGAVATGAEAFWIGS